MEEIILIKNGEIALKGLNRSTFEDRLIKNIRRRLSPLGKFQYRKAQSTIYVEPESEDIDLIEAEIRVSKIFGIAGYSRACVVEKNFEDIKQKTVEYLEKELKLITRFKVEAKRSDKTFPMNSPELCRELGGHLLDSFPHLQVDVRTPEIVVYVEIRDFAAYIHVQQKKGAGGIPVGCGGKATLLISGGIDSPVAGYMMAKRGLEISAVHFVSPPYTSDRALQKVEELAEKMAYYCGNINLFVVPFTEIQEQIRDNCPEDYFTLIMRRYMMKISEKISTENESMALITGESLGQVASQTIQAIACTNQSCEIPVFRPVIGMDKNEIIDIARKIDTFETSIQPYEDCCTVFTPKHPRTKPRMKDIYSAESKLNEQELIDKAILGTVRKYIK